MNDSATIDLLLELIAGLERRVPQMQRAGEIAIAEDAAALKARAFARIAELKGEAQKAAGTTEPAIVGAAGARSV